MTGIISKKLIKKIINNYLKKIKNMFEKIDKERIFQKKTISKLCRDADITEPCYYRLKQGKSNFKTINKLCKALNISDLTFTIK